MLNPDVAIERHVTHHDSDILWRNETVVIKVVHIESESHLALQVTDEDCNEVAMEAGIGDKLSLFAFLHVLLRNLILHTAYRRH